MEGLMIDVSFAWDAVAIVDPSQVSGGQEVLRRRVTH
jgi:hypothetical protein